MRRLLVGKNFFHIFRNIVIGRLRGEKHLSFSSDGGLRRKIRDCARQRGSTRVTMHYLSPSLRKLLGGAIKHCNRERKRERKALGFPGARSFCSVKKKKKKKCPQQVPPDAVIASRACALTAARKSSGPIDHFPAADIVHASGFFRHGTIIYQETRMGPGTFE